MPTLTLYTRRDCRLCDEMKTVVRAVAATLPLTCKDVDVDGDPRLAQAYGRDVPVLLADGREIARHRVTAARLRQLLAETGGAGHQGT